MKYVVIKRKIADGVYQEVPVIFPNMLSHVDVAKALLRGCPEFSDVASDVVSAGELSSLDISADCHGHSVTLNVSSRPTDSKLIETFDYSHGYS